MSGFFIMFWGFFKVNSGIFLHNRVATLVWRLFIATSRTLSTLCLQSLRMRLLYLQCNFL